MRPLFLILFFVGSTFWVSYAQKGKPADQDTVVTGLQAMAEIEGLPVLFPPGTKTHRFISYDASGGNGFGFFQSTFQKYIDDRGELVIFDAYGPGCLYRQQMNIWKGIGKMSPTIRIKYYFDDEKTPRVDAPVKAFFDGRYAPAGAPFTMMGKNDNFGISYYPFPFKERLKVTLSDTLITRLVKEHYDDGRNWYQYDYLTYPPETKLTSWEPASGQDAGIVSRQWSHLGEDPKDTAGNRYAGQEISLQPHEKAVVFDLKAQASIAAIKLKIEPFNAETFYHTYIRVYWDGAKQPAVDMPVSYFFGAGGWKDNEWRDSLKNLLFGFNAAQHTLYCYWPMPFWQKARIEIVNEGKEPISKLTSLISYKPASVYAYAKRNAAYFMAKLTKDSSSGGQTRQFKRPYVTAFKEAGHGKVVSVNMWSGNFLEDGDEFTYIDDAHMPRIHGDGTEDDFNQGWGGSRYEKPLWGALISGVKGSYRLHLNAPYIFYHDIDMRFEEHGGRYGDAAMKARRRTGTPDSMVETEFVVCYYKKPGAGILQLSDSLDVGNTGSEKAHAYAVQGAQWKGTLTQSYDSYETEDNYDETTDDGRAFNGYAEFKMRLNPHNRGVRLVSRINRYQNGIQIARVYVDGKKLPVPWQIITYSDMAKKGNRSFDGWFDGEYEIPEQYTQGKRQITIRIEYVRSVRQRLNSFFYWVYDYLG